VKEKVFSVIVYVHYFGGKREAKKTLIVLLGLFPGLEQFDGTLYFNISYGCDGSSNIATTIR
jgi:hypothetical protein